MRGLLLLILCFYLFGGLGFKSTFCSVRSRRSYRNFLLMRSRPCLVDLFSDLPQLCRWRRLSRALVLRLPFFFSNLISVSSFFMLLSGGRRCLTVMEASSVAPSLCVPACVTTKADLWRVAEVSLRLRQV
ncbi:unnamed protein product [Arabidopsis thaliana]|uniref:Transmembrane protein n=1 Tax=Arabidopsis thaliana TaxID=3702 RepID=A0A5S9XHJ4_ARATH|nr:unnamed protein product [Arabidopsis thaliana]